MAKFARNEHAEAHPPSLELAYRNPAFLDGDAGRPIRILSEYLAPLASFTEAKVHDTVVFFGSARAQQGGPMDRYYEEARELSRLVTLWAQSMPDDSQRLVVCTGGGGGIMEAANRGAVEAGGRTIGLNIGLPHEQRPNAWLTPELSFEFHYFFMRKLWFTHMARAFVAFPGGFGTLDELFEILTLMQTRKLERQVFVLLYGSSYWKEVIDFPALVRHGVIAPEDLQLFRFADEPAQALALLQAGIELNGAAPSPALAKSTTPASPRPAPRRKQNR